MLLGTFQPFLAAFGQGLIDPVLVFVGVRVIDHAGDMT